MCGPPRVADTGFPSQWFMHQQVGQVYQFAKRTAAFEFIVIDGGNTGTVVATVFKPFERLNQDGSCFVIS